MTTDALVLRIHGTYLTFRSLHLWQCVCRCSGRMAIQTDGFIRFRTGIDVCVRIMAGDTGESVFALLVALAQRQTIRLHTVA